MRCPNCNKFVSFDTDADLEVFLDVDGDTGQITGVRIVNSCAECGTELKEATFDVDHDELIDALHRHRADVAADRIAQLTNENDGIKPTDAEIAAIEADVAADHTIDSDNVGDGFANRTRAGRRSARPEDPVGQIRPPLLRLRTDRDGDVQLRRNVRHDRQRRDPRIRHGGTGMTGLQAGKLAATAERSAGRSLSILRPSGRPLGPFWTLVAGWVDRIQRRRLIRMQTRLLRGLGRCDDHVRDWRAVEQDRRNP